MAVLVTKWFGVFLVERGRVEREQRFPEDARAIADRLLLIRREEVLEEETALAKGGHEVLEQRLKGLGTLSSSGPFFDLDVKEPDRALLREATLLVARDESRQASGERDRFVAQSVRAMDELTKTFNTLAERAREWYGLHYPEALAKLSDASKLVETLAKDPSRPGVQAALGVKAGESIGVEFDESELAAVQAFTASIEQLHRERERLERLVAKETSALAPNLSRVVGDVLAAKLIAQAGSLERLAHMPASTLQTLGAETALFQHLKEGTKPPKHGLLFQHGLVNTAPWWHRGKVSRILAGNALLAARLDYFGGPTDRSDALVARVEAQVKRVKAQKRRETPPREDRRPRPPQVRAAPGGRR